MSFESRFDELIGIRLGLSPKQVTIQMIHEWREKYIYPTARYDLNTNYGGYMATGKRVLTSLEIKEIGDRVDAFLDDIDK